MALTSTEEAQVRQLIGVQSATLSLASNEATIISKLAATKVNLSQLPAASAVADSDLMLIRQGGTDRSVAGSLVKPTASESVAGVAEIATQAETNAGTDDARVVTPKKLRFGFAILLAADGYIAFPSWLGGLILQWGDLTTNGSGDATVTLPLAYPSTLLLAMATPQFGSATNYSTGTSTYSPTGFVVKSVNSANTGTAVAVSWLSLGF